LTDAGRVEPIRFAVTPGYFEALRIPLRRGRLPVPTDAADARQ